MAKLTIVIDNWGHKDLKEYLMSLHGILDVIINNKDVLEIDIKYDSKIITPKIIKLEILLFLNILKAPSILSFDKHSNVKMAEYKIIRNDICCEYCFKEAIDDLFEMDGVENVESNFNAEEYYQKHYDGRDNIIVSVHYNPDLLSFEDMKQIESQLTL